MVAKNAVRSFPLKGFAPPVKGICHLNDLKSPDAEFRPEAAWVQTYNLYSLAGRGSNYGMVEIERRPGAGTTTLAVAYRKRTSAAPMLVLNAEMEVENDLLGTPLRWEFESWTETAPSKILDETRLSKRGVCDPKGVEVEAGRHRYRLQAEGPYAINWSLCEAVQRMPRQADFASEIFTLFDHFDQPKPEQKMRFWESVEMELPDGRSMSLHCLEQVGRGVLPIYYYVSDRGQLMAVISGVEGYLLTGTREV